MKINLGRPKIGKELEKSEFLSTRVANVEALPAATLALKAGKSKAEWLREVVKTEIQRPPIWVRSNWTKEELNGQLIRFDLTSPARELGGVGKLSVRRNPKGEIAVDIFIDEFPSYGEGITTRIWLAKSAVDKIQFNTDPDSDKIKFKVTT